MKLSTEWMKDGTCRSIPVADKDKWFFSQDPATIYKDRARAKQVCHICPVVKQCGVYAILNKESTDSHSRNIVWGAMMYRDRLEHYRDAKRHGLWEQIVEDSGVVL